MMPGNTLENPVTGELIQVLESSPAIFRVQYSLRPHASIPGEHFHPNKEQRISVLSGEMHLRISGQDRVVRAGETATIPVGARHFQWNPCDIEAVVIEDIRPAGRIHEFFRVLFGLAADGRTDASGYPPPLLAAALFSEFADTIRPGPLGSRMLFAVLAPLSSLTNQRRHLVGYLQDGSTGR